MFCNFLLADEINRALAKAQSALLEVTQERQVTIGATTHAVLDPFLVLATQNPIEAEGTYPLPEAQVDRFMMKVVVDYPDFGDELTVVQRSLAAAQELHLGHLRRLAARSPGATSTSTRTWRHTPSRSRLRRAAWRARPCRPGALRRVRVSPRGSINLVHGARALALLRGRAYALPRTSATWRKMSSAIGSCSRTRPWPHGDRRPDPRRRNRGGQVPEIDLARENALHDGLRPGSHARRPARAPAPRRSCALST